jgi:photosystem II stability/assembly factor-like uncharacterized protein
MQARSLSLVLSSLLLVAAIGPARADAAPWTPVGPGSGYVARLASAIVHPASPDWIWAGLPEGGLYRSTDRGAHWTWAGQPFVSPWGGVVAVTADRSRPGALWAAVHDGFFRSEDGGVHWTLLAGAGFTPLLGEASPLAVSDVQGTLYVLTSRRLIASLDAGRSWEVRFDIASLGENGRIHDFAVHPSASGALYLAVFGPEAPALLQSLDAGHTWSPVTNAPVPDSGIGQLVATPQGVYVANHGDASGLAGLFRSTDGGLTWQALLGGTPDRQVDVASLAVDPRLPRTLYLTGAVLSPASPEQKLWISRNAGRTWTVIGPPPGGVLRIDSAGGALYALDAERLQRSMDGGLTWATVLQAPESESSFARLAISTVHPSSLALTVGWTSYRSANGGRSWRLVNTPRGVRDLDVDPANPNRLTAVTASEAFLSGDSGKTWRKAATGFWYVELLVRADERTLLAGGAGLYRSGDNGQTWQTVLAGWAPGSNTGRWAQKIEVDPADPGDIYALTFLIEVVEPPHDVLADSPSALWKSTDGGRTWRKTALNLRTFAVDPASSRLYGVRNRDLLQSDDGGRSWKRVARTPGLVHELVIDPADPNTFYVAGRGLWRSRDRGATWEQLASEWTPATLKIHPADPQLLYGADRYGVFQIRVPAEP